MFLPTTSETPFDWEAINYDAVTIEYRDNVLTITFGEDAIAKTTLQAIDQNLDGIYRVKINFIDNSFKSSYNESTVSIQEDYRLKVSVPFDVENNQADYEQPITTKFYNVADWHADRVNDPVVKPEAVITGSLQTN